MSDQLYEDKKLLLIKNLKWLCKEDLLLAFSGGVDSALLLSLLKEYTDQNRSGRNQSG